MGFSLPYIPCRLTQQVGETQCVRCGAVKISWESFWWHPFSSGSSARAGRQPGKEEGDFSPSWEICLVISWCVLFCKYPIRQALLVSLAKLGAVCGFLGTSPNPKRFPPGPREINQPAVKKATRLWRSWAHAVGLPSGWLSSPLQLVSAAFD